MLKLSVILFFTIYRLLSLVAASSKSHSSNSLEIALNNSYRIQTNYQSFALVVLNYS